MYLTFNEWIDGNNVFINTPTVLANYSNKYYGTTYAFSDLGFDTTDEIQEYFGLLYGDLPIRYDSETENLLQKMTNLVTSATKSYLSYLCAEINVIKTEYNPIDNYNMVETGTDTINRGSRNHKHTPDGKEDTVTATSSANNTATATETLGKTTSTKESSYDNASGYPTTTITESGSPSSNTTSNTTGTNTTKTKIVNGYTDIDSEVSDSTNHNLTRKGNIGVTTTQQMFQQELNLKKTNIIEEYLNYIKSRILLGCY